MGRVLGMTLTTIRTVESLRQRQRLLEQHAAIQRAIAVRAPLAEVLELIMEASATLLEVEVVCIRLLEPDDEARTRIAASRGLPPALVAQIERGHLEEGIAGRAIADDCVVVSDDYAQSPLARPELVELGLRGGMAAPIHDRGTPIGCLVVGAAAPRRLFSSSERETLVAFAQHVSLALLDARTVDELLRQALHDPLTALPNRALFLDRLGHALARADRGRTSVAVLFLDLDRFKGVNDTLGHAAGDALLIEVGRRLEGFARSTDTVARFGGDEFAILLEDIDRRPRSRAPRSVARRAPAAALPDRERGDLDHRERRARARRVRARRPVARRRPGALPRQERRPQPPRGLRRRDARRLAHARSSSRPR